MRGKKVNFKIENFEQTNKCWLYEYIFTADGGMYIKMFEYVFSWKKVEHYMPGETYVLKMHACIYVYIYNYKKLVNTSICIPR